MGQLAVQQQDSLIDVAIVSKGMGHQAVEVSSSCSHVNPHLMNIYCVTVVCYGTGELVTAPYPGHRPPAGTWPGGRG